MKEKIIFDTNFLFNKVASTFFGSRNELNTFLNDDDYNKIKEMFENEQFYFVISIDKVIRLILV